MTLLHHIPYQAMVSENDQPSEILRQWSKVFGHFRFVLYISYKSSF